MIKASHHWFYTVFFNSYIATIIKRDFYSVEINGECILGNKPVLLIGNHISWWDGFWALYINNKLFKKKIHVMMLEEQLEKRKFLSKIGAFSINPGARSVIESLDYASELLKDDQNIVVIYPQGKLNSMVQSEIVFQKGVERILKQSFNADVVFYVAMVDYFSHRKPTLYVYLKQIEIEQCLISGLNSMYNDFHQECLRLQKSKAE